MNAKTISKIIASVAISAVLAGCGTVQCRSKSATCSRFDAPRGQIGRSFAVRRSDAPRGQIGQAYAVNAIPAREHILPDSKRFV